MRSLVCSLIVAAALASPGLAQGRLSVDSVIAWLPANTETLIVATGPIASADASERQPMLFASLLGEMAALGPSFNRTQSIFQPLDSAHLRFAVEGARAFHQPRGFGFALYDGCHIAVFDPVDGPLIDEFIRRAHAASDSSVRVANLGVLRLQWRAEQDNWSAFIVRLRRNVILIARSEAMLTEVLERETHAGPASALPSSLREWSAVDTTAPVWAIRHYAHTGNQHDATSPLTREGLDPNVLDSLAVGVTVSIAPDSGTVIAHYLSRNPQAERVARQIWAHVSAASFNSDQDGVRITIAPPADREARGILFLVIFGLLGHELRF